MNNLPKILALFLLLSGLINSCTPKEQPENELSNEKGVTLDSNAAPPFIEPPRISLDSQMAMIVKLLGLNNIKSGHSKEEIRIWINYALTDSGIIVVIKNDKEKWHSSAYYYEAHFDDRANVISLKKNSQENTPTSGWDVFLKKLRDLGMYELKNYDEIPDYSSCNDGDHMFIEIWRAGQYHIYDYHCFDIYWDELKELKRVKEIGLLVQNEFGYRLFPDKIVFKVR